MPRAGPLPSRLWVHDPGMRLRRSVSYKRPRPGQGDDGRWRCAAGMAAPARQGGGRCAAPHPEPRPHPRAGAGLRVPPWSPPGYHAAVALLPAGEEHALGMVSCVQVGDTALVTVWWDGRGLGQPLLDWGGAAAGAERGGAWGGGPVPRPGRRRAVGRARGVARRVRVVEVAARGERVPGEEPPGGQGAPPAAGRGGAPPGMGTAACCRLLTASGGTSGSRSARTRAAGRCPHRRSPRCPRCGCRSGPRSGRRPEWRPRRRTPRRPATPPPGRG